MNNKLRWIASVMLLCLAGSLAAAESDPFDPTVTTEEAGILDRAMNLASNDVPAAIQVIKAADSSKASPALPFAMGNLYFRSEQYAEAAGAYREAISRLPRFRSALANLGRVYLITDQADRAVETYQTLVRDGQADARILVLLGQALVIDNRPVSAETAFRHALLLEPESVDARVGLAQTLLAQERYRETLALLGEVAVEDPGRADVWALKANAGIAVGDIRSAAVSLECSRRIGVANSEMLATLGDLYLNRDQPSDALKAYSEAFAQGEPSLDRIVRAASGFMTVGDATGARAMIERARQLEQSRAGEVSEDEITALLKVRGALALMENRIEEAVDIYKSAVARAPLDDEALISLGDAHRRAGRIEEAVMSYERASRISGAEARALARQAQAEVDRGRYDEAVRLLTAAQAFDYRSEVATFLDQIRRLAEFDG